MSTAPAITASLTQSNMNVTIPVMVTNPAPPAAVPTFVAQGSVDGSGSTSYTLTLNGPTNSGDTVVLFARASDPTGLVFSGLGATWTLDQNSDFWRAVGTGCTAGQTVVTITRAGFVFSVTALAGVWSNAGVPPGGPGVGFQEGGVGPTTIDAVTGSTVSPVSGQLSIVGWALDNLVTGGVTTSFSDTNGSYNQLTPVSSGTRIVEMGWAVVPANGFTNHVGSRTDSATGSGAIYLFGPNVESGPGATGPFTYTIDYDDGVTDSFTTSSTTHTFTHTFLDTTTKVIKVQASNNVAPYSIIDNFNRSDNSLTLGTTSDGAATWATTSTNNVPWGIATNTAKMFGGLGEDAQAYVDGTVADGVIQATFVTLDNVSGVRTAGPMFRWSDHLNFWFVECKDINEPFQSVLIKRVNNSKLTVGPTFAVAAGDTVAVALAADLIKVAVNGTIVSTVSDSFNQTATKHGMYSETQVSHFDNWSFSSPPTQFSNIVLLYPIWVTNSAVNNSTRTAFI